MLAEEGVAHAYTEWLAGEKMDGVINKAFKKLQTFLKAVYQSLTGHDIRTADDIFRQMASGKIGQRTQRGAGGRAQRRRDLHSADHGQKRWIVPDSCARNTCKTRARRETKYMTRRAFSSVTKGAGALRSMTRTPCSI